ncbi:TPA: hypothetical protein EYP26_01500, partial [Candidatus Bathyarchaeota archaeon]|nr:hypothetical protein [Candidatus Bathyarchaeota archaeon]
FLALLMLCSFWGLAFVAIKVGLNYLSPIALTFLRFSIASLMFALYFLLRRILIPLSLLPKVALLGLVGFTIYHLSLNLGEVEVAAGVASLVIACTPTFIALLSRFLLKERVTALKAIGIASAFLGLAVILAPNLKVSGSPFHVLAILPAPISAALYTVLGKLYLRRCEPAVLTGYAQLLGLLLLTPVITRSTLLEVAALPLEGWIPLLFLGACSTALGYTIWYKLLKVAETSIVGSYIYLVSLIAVLSGHAILNEPLTPNLVAGGGLVVAGVYLVHRNRGAS